MVSEPHSSLRPTALSSCSPGPPASWPLVHRQAAITSLRGPRWSPSPCPQPHQGPPPASSCVPSPVSGPATHTLRTGLLAPHPPSLACRSLSASPHFLPPGSLHSGHPAVGRPPAGTGAGLPVTPDRVPTLLAGSPGSLALRVTVGLVPFFPPLSLVGAPKLGVCVVSVVYPIRGPGSCCFSRCVSSLVCGGPSGTADSGLGCRVMGHCSKGCVWPLSRFPGGSLSILGIS